MADNDDEILPPTPNSRRLLPQPHGGALRPPFTPGAAASAAARSGTSMRAVRKKCRELLLDADEDNTKELLALCKNGDARVRVVAIQEAKNRLWGRVGDTGLAHDPDRSGTSFDHMTPAELEEMQAMTRRMKDLMAPRGTRTPGIEGDGDE